VRFSGSVSPAHNGGIAKLQRRTSSGFKTVKTATLTAATATSSHYSLRVRVKRNGTYRVRVEADAAHVAGNSRRVSLKVH
jgi:predicted glutamine amidotransferase